MPSILDRATKHYHGLLDDGLRSIEVPEWEDEKGNPTVIFYRPTINLMQQQKIYKLWEAKEADRAVAQTLIVRALNADGTPMFTQSSMTILLREVDSKTLHRIVGDMGGDDLSVDDAEKN